MITLTVRGNHLQCDMKGTCISCSIYTWPPRTKEPNVYYHCEHCKMDILCERGLSVTYDYFDDGFVSFMNSLGGQKPVEQSIHDGIALGVKHVDITYESSAIFGDYVIVKTKVDKIGNKTITFHHEIFKESNDEKLSNVKATRFALDLKAKKLINIIDYFIDFLSE